MAKDMFKSKDSKKVFMREDGESKEREAETYYKIKAIRIYSKYFVGAREMFGFFLDFDLTKLEHDIANMLLHTIESNNLLFYSEEDYSQTLGIHAVSLRKCMAKLVKLNIVKRIQRRDGYSVLRLNPHILWMGDPELCQKLQAEFSPLVVNSTEERKKLVSCHDQWIKKIKIKEKKLKNESLYARIDQSTNSQRRTGYSRRIPQKQNECHT